MSASAASGWYVRLPVGSVVVMPSGATYRLVASGDLEPIAFGGLPHGLMNTTAPVAVPPPLIVRSGPWD